MLLTSSSTDTQPHSMYHIRDTYYEPQQTNLIVKDAIDTEDEQVTEEAS